MGSHHLLKNREFLIPCFSESYQKLILLLNEAATRQKTNPRKRITVSSNTPITECLPRNDHASQRPTPF